jgi:excisionase family DNA binding protein
LLSARRYYTTFEASHFLGVSLPTVVNWIKASRLKAHRTPGGHRRIAREELASFIRRHGMPMPPELAQEGEAARVLIVAAERTFGEQLVGMLERAGYDALAVGGGFEAGLAVGQFRPDLMLADLAEGGALIAPLRAQEQTKRLPLIALAGAREERVARRACGAGFDDFLQKPLEAEDLKRKIETALRSRRSP